VADQIKLRQIPALLVSHDAADREFTTGPVLQFLEKASFQDHAH
jgi:hypothetical protein